MSLPDYAATLGTNDSAGSLSDRWLTIPKSSESLIKVNGAEIKSLPKLKPAVLTNVKALNYTPDAILGNYEGANPVAYDMTLNFTETEIITQTEVINQGF